MAMTGRERIKALVENRPVDRTPITAWKHFPFIDLTDELAPTHIKFVDDNGFDILKSMSNPSYMYEAYGCKVEFYHTEEEFFGRHSDIKSTPINSIDDLYNLPVLTKDNPVLQREIKYAKACVDHYKGEKVVICTINNPLTALKKMTMLRLPPVLPWTGDPSIPMFLRGEPVYTVGDVYKIDRQAVHAALSAIQQTNKNYVDALIEAGIDGVFYVVQQGTYGSIGLDDFEDLCRKYDIEFLNYIKDRTWFNALHMHGYRNVMLKEVLDYPVQAYNWEDNKVGKVLSDSERLSFKEARTMTNKILMGGLDMDVDFTYTEDRKKYKDNIRTKYRYMVKELGSKEFIFCGGCSIPADGINPALISTIQDVVDEEAKYLY